MLKLLHYCIADPTNMPSFPSEWGAPPVVTEQDRKIVPFCLASTLWSDVGSNFYEKCTVGRDRPGWVSRDEEKREVVWKILPSASASDLELDAKSDSNEESSSEWKWIHLADLETANSNGVGADMSIAARQTLLQANGETTLFAHDPAPPSCLAAVPLRCFDARPSSWTVPASEEPVGIRIPPTSPEGKEALVLFVWSDNMIGPRVLITHIANLTPDQLPTLLQALDKIGNQSGRKEGWVWGLDPESELVKAWKGMPGRETSVGNRPEYDGHLLGTAWYGKEEERGFTVDVDMWSWC